jgi:hypothetical protein
MKKYVSLLLVIMTIFTLVSGIADENEIAAEDDYLTIMGGYYDGKRWEWDSGTKTIRLTRFYELKGKQYAAGTMDTLDGIPASIAMVRP